MQKTRSDLWVSFACIHARGNVKKQKKRRALVWRGLLIILEDIIFCWLLDCIKDYVSKNQIIEKAGKLSAHVRGHTYLMFWNILQKEVLFLSFDVLCYR
jgi:hypothetical protein